jgi:polyphosphate kinase
MKGKFFNRELSWLAFNERVVAEAGRVELPLLERLKFLSIAGSNFDEFFMVRVASLKRQAKAGDSSADPSGMSPAEQLRAIAEASRRIMAEQYRHLNDSVLPGLESAGLSIVRPADYSTDDARFLEHFFESELFSSLTPMRLKTGEDTQALANVMLHAAFLLRGEEAPDGEIAVIQLPNGYARFIPLPSAPGRERLALLEDVILMFGKQLFSGYTILERACFRVTRDADVGVDEDRDDDFVEAMEELISGRGAADPVRLNIGMGSKEIRNRLGAALGLAEDDIYDVDGPLDIKAFMDIAFRKGYDSLREAPRRAVWPATLDPDAGIMDQMRARDILVHHPYESFEPVIRFIEEAADDPAVIAIKMTLYRTSGDSPFVKALKRAAASGKQVTALVELKARFDEERNITWANSLERSGVIVIYGIARLKVHAKALLVVRREAEGVRRYVHLATGNYNDKTAKLYGDLGLLTAREELTYEVALFFNAITGYSSLPGLKLIAMAPTQLKKRLIGLIEREASRAAAGMPARILAKMNSLADPDVIDALYAASMAGVEVRLNVRGICMLRPGIPGLSENIEVTGIIDRYLEHARAFWFQNGGSSEAYLSSADWMPRNLDRRVELLFPVLDEALKQELLAILESYLSDTSHAWRLAGDGSYQRVAPADDDAPFRAQDHFYEKALARYESAHGQPIQELTVRRKPPEAPRSGGPS